MTESNRSFLQLFSEHSSELGIKFREPDYQVVKVEHRLGSGPTTQGSDFLDSICDHIGAAEFCSFYRQFDGAEICRTFHARHRENRPLVKLLPSGSIQEFTNRYMPGGDLSWTIDLNKSRALYRTEFAWIAFAEVGTGPCCLTMFLNGENAGRIYYAAPQPPFNILRPIAQSFSELLERIAKDLPAFLRLIRASVTIRGSDGDYYGFTPVDYFADGNKGRTT